MKISVIIPAFNEVATIEEAVKRVQRVSLDIDKEIIIVDDGSTDGTARIIENIKGDNIVKLFHKKNTGKGGGVKTGLAAASGELVIIQDADLEYNPADYPALIEPIINGQADAVFGSRFIGAHRCFLFTHYLGNKILNQIANILYNTNLSDFMTGYKVFSRDVLNDMNLISNGFGFEAEITGKLFKKHYRVYEVPVSYEGRDYPEGKKIQWFHFFNILWWLFYTKIKPLDNVAFDTLDKLVYTQNYSFYIFDKFKGFLGKRVLEIGAGIGSITRLLLVNRELVVASDKSKKHIFYLSQKIPNSSIFRAILHDIEQEPIQILKDFAFDTVLCINVLEHIKDDGGVLKKIFGILQNQGRLILVVPVYSRLFYSFDERLGHLRRYDKKDLEALLNHCGFQIERLRYLNFLGVLAWWLNFKFLRKEMFSASQLLVFNNLIGLVRILDRLFTTAGLSLLVLAKKK